MFSTFFKGQKRIESSKDDVILSHENRCATKINRDCGRTVLLAHSGLTTGKYEWKLKIETTGFPDAVVIGACHPGVENGRVPGCQGIR
eukprot:gnl/Dysnectes_brevis/4134_a5447_1057.p1 GENE.gnl/Dysnectes_brevis/4134_a5447_1057~~gnl/Dysnectes_brevis/4134_a5447_1057.p1  ORF type:complete len:103 (-),score=1.86 gnl/Dysnectes_brevis/4134_a5447_1057:92-355(-)